MGKSKHLYVRYLTLTLTGKSSRKADINADKPLKAAPFYCCLLNTMSFAGLLFSTTILLCVASAVLCNLSKPFVHFQRPSNKTTRQEHVEHTQSKDVT